MEYESVWNQLRASSDRETWDAWYERVRHTSELIKHVPVRMVQPVSKSGVDEEIRSGEVVTLIDMRPWLGGRRKAFQYTIRTKDGTDHVFHDACSYGRYFRFEVCKGVQYTIPTSL